MFLVTRHGVYMRGIVGVFSTKERAEEAIKFAQEAEEDDYHDFKIIEAEMNVKHVGDRGILGGLR